MSLATVSETEIRAVIDTWLAAVRSNDSGKIAEIHAEQGRILVAGMPIVSGRPAIGEFWKGLLAATNDTVVFGPTTIDVDASGTMAFEIGTYSFATGPEAESTESSGKYVVVWRKIDGRWQVCVDSLVSN